MSKYASFKTTVALTFEAVIVRHKNRFDAKVVEVAQWRLDNPYWDKF